MNQPDVNQLVDQITDYVNTFSLDPGEFCQAMGREHRTLQQSFTRLVLTWLEYVGSEEYRHDGRNAQAHRIAKQLVQLFQEANHGQPPSGFLPYI